MRPAFDHRRCDDTLWRHPVPQTTSKESLLRSFVLGDVNLQQFGSKCVSTRYQQPVAVSTARIVEHPILLTVLSVKTLVGEEMLPFHAQRQVHSE